MKLALKNVGKIESAVVELTGITVIAGENNTGKSTVGKALFSFFNSFYDIKNQIKNERNRTVLQLLISLFRDFPMYSTEYSGLSEEIINSTSSKLSHKDVEKIIIDFLEKKDVKSIVNIQDSEIDEISTRIFEILEISDDEILKNIIMRQIDSEFSGQINNVYSEKIGKVELTIKHKSAFFEVENNIVTKINGNFDLRTEVVYIDNPFAIDELYISAFMNKNTYYSDHKNHLRKKLFLDNSSHDIINEIINTNKLNDIYNKISTVCGGEMVKNKRSGVGYKKKDSDKIIDMKNISTGLKTFVILKTLLQNGTLQYNGTIILDEPEIHLHPQWQLLFAELIVLIQKEFNMHILLNTHSPYFLKAIEVYSAKHEIADKCKYYLAYLNGDVSVIDDVSGNTEKIYKLLARPLQDLENVRWEND